jgi:putative Mn2+ efflux pump MntP
MKQLYFIKWCLKGISKKIKDMDRWMWAWAITCGWGPSAITDRVEFPTSYNLFLAFVFIFWIGYGLIYTSIKNAYRKFQEEQVRTFQYLKDEK